MLIVHVESPNRGHQGDSVYRTVQPCRALGELPGVEVVSGSWLSPAVHELALQADLLVLCDVVEVDAVGWVTAREHAGRLTLYEINDDFLAPQSWSPTAYLARNPVTRSLSSLLAHASDGVSFTVRTLEERYRELNPVRAVLRNQLWELPPFVAAKPGPLRIGWGGSLGHKEDFAAVVPTLARVLRRHPDVSCEIMAAPELHALATALPAAQTVLTPAGSLARYYEFLDRLDIGLCPLLDTPFNRCRSDVKFLEYAAHGVAAVCAALPPYDEVVHERTGLLYSCNEELETALERLIADHELRGTLTAAAYQNVASRRTERARVGDRLAFFAEAAARAQRLLPDRTAPLAVHGARAFAGSRYHALGDGLAERALYAGLVAARAGQQAAAQESWQRAAAAAPTFYVPWLFLASVLTGAEAIVAAERACALKPASAAAWLMRGDLHRARDDQAAAEVAYARAEQASPALGVPSFKLGELAEERGDAPAARLAYDRARSVNPWFVPAPARAASAALDAHDPAEAARVLRTGLAHDPQHWLLRWLLGRACLALGAPAEAREHLLIALDHAEDRRPVLAQLAKAEATLGNLDRARDLLAALRGSADSRPSSPGGPFV